MPVSLKRVSLALGVGGVIAVVLLAPSLLLNSAFMTERLQAKTATSFALELGIGGALELDFYPDLQVTLHDLQFSRQGSTVATVAQVRIGLDLWPLLHNKISINSLVLQDPEVTLERFADGTYNVRKPEPQVTLNLARVQVANGTFHFTDAQRGRSYAAQACNLDLHAARPLTRDSREHLAELALTATAGCAELRKDALTLADVDLSATAQAGVIRFDPVSMLMFGARGTGRFQADFSGAVPAYNGSYALPQFRIDDVFRLLMPQSTPAGTLVEGAMDFTATLSMQGQTLAAALPTLAGQLALRGDNLVVNGTDLDAQFARYESSQNFNLVDAGAFLFVGPLGLVLTKGYNFANIFLDSGSQSEIRSLVSDWEVAGGVAQAQYVMMTTNANRVALKGGLDFAGEQFNDVTVALLDEDGCARVEQTLRGPFQQPDIEKPNVLRSLAGPVLSLLQKLLPGQPCEVWYPQGAPQR